MGGQFPRSLSPLFFQALWTHHFSRRLIPLVVPNPLFSTPIFVLQQHNEQGGQF
jgi:hypothetical protein